MAANVLCVIRDDGFKDTAKRLNISENQLEGILHEYFNDPAVVDKKTYPSDKFILSKVQGQPFLGDENQVYLWNQKYNKPIQAANVQELNALKEHLEQFFPPESIGVKENADGTYTVTVSKPRTEHDFLWRGTSSVPTIDANGNLILKPFTDSLWKSFGISFATNLENAYNYGRRSSKNPFIIRVDKSFIDSIYPLNTKGGTQAVGERVYGDIYNETEWEERVVMNQGDSLVIPKGLYSIERDSVSLNDNPVRAAEEVLHAEAMYNVGDELPFSSTYEKYSSQDIKDYWKALVSLVGSEEEAYYYMAEAAMNNTSDAGAAGRSYWELMEKTTPERRQELEDRITEFYDATGMYPEGEQVNLLSSHRDKRLDELVKKGNASIVDLLSLVDDSSEYSGIIELLKTKKDGRKPLLEGVQVKLVEGNKSGIFDKSRAFYNSKNKTIYINTLGNYRGGRADSVIMHEVMHAITVNRILGNKAYRAEFDKIISEYQKNFFNIRYSKNGVDKEMASHYMEEFIADVWSNIDTINNLKSIKVNTRQTLWDRIKNFFIKIFGGSDGTLMAQASDAIYRLLDQPELVRTSGSYYESETLEVSTAGDEFGKQFSAFNAKFKQGTVIDGVDVSGRSIEDVYQHVIKKSGKGKSPASYSKLSILYRGYATKENTKAADLDETVAGTAKDYVEGITGFIPKYHFTTSREEAEEYAKQRTDKSEEEFYRDGNLVKQQNRHYTGDYAQVGTYYLSKDANTVVFEDLHDLNKNPQAAEGADVIILKKGTLDQSASEFIVRDGAKNLVRELKDSSEQGIQNVSYQEGYLPLWRKWARQNPELIEQLRQESAGKTLTDKFAKTSVSQARALTQILRETALQVSPQRMVRDGIRPELQSEFDRVTRQNNQINTLLNSDVITSTDISKAADVVSNWISERLTEYHTNPEMLFKQYTDIKRTNDWATEEDKQKDIDAISKLSRKEIVEKIGIDNFLEAARFSVFDNAIITDVETMDKATLFSKNFEGLKVYINQLVTDNEGFVINTVEEDSVEAPQLQEVENNLISEGTDTTDTDSLNEVTTDRTEHYAIESRTLDTWKTATQAVRDAFKQCYVLDENGKAVVNEYHQYDRVNPLEAMQEVLHWIQGSINSNDMITKLKEKETSNPWISQIISRLEDRTGKEADFRSQFFKSLYKAEQSYYVQIKRNGKVVSIPVNELPALNSVVNIIKADYNIGRHPLFTNSGIDVNRLSTIEKYLDDFRKVNDAVIFNDIMNDDARRDKLVHAVADVSYLLGYAPDIIDVKKALSKDSFDAIVKALGDMDKVFRKNLNKREYNPFKYGDDSIIGYLKSFLTPLTEALEDKTLNSFYTNHKMYQGHVNPSYTTKMMDKLGGNQQTFEKYIMEEFANTEWFVEETGLTMEQLRTTKQSAIRNLTLQKLIAMPEAERQRFVGHKVLLNYQGKEYMRDMTSSQYIMSVLTEFASEKGKSTEEQIPAWYVFPMESNKPSEELFKSFRFIGDNYHQTILRGMRMVFNQELSRIQTVMMRNLEKDDEGFIENFDGKDGNGRKFNFLPWMNDYLEGGSKADSDAGKEIQRKLRGDKEELKRNPIREDIIKNAVNADTEAYFNDVFRKTREKYKENGVYEKLKDIENVGSSERQIDDFLENFVWNHIYAENSFLQFAVSDIAYYKHAEDLQKRLAQLHSPGLVGDRFATDYNGNSVSDGKYRVFYLSDLEHIKANVVDNLRAYFSQREDQIQDPKSREAYHAFAESFISNYDDFNVTDGQAFTTMTGLRKKSFINGNWSQELESIWEKFRDGKFNTSDLQTASQVKKNFTYTQITKKSNVDGAPIQTLKMGVQHKDSEALLWMAYGIIGDTDTGRPNILRAIMRVMEQSQYKKFVPDESGIGGHWEDSVDANGKPLPVQTGLDTMIFHSGVKTGYMKGIDLNDLLEDPDGEAKAIARLESLFDTSSPYGWNPNYVHEIAVEDVAQQLEVPSHLRDHENIWGSQERYIIPSAVETVFNGKPVEYSVKMSDGERKLSAEQFQREYESVAAQNIQDSINELCEELGINEYATSEEYDRNYALSRILRREIISSPRYGSDLLIACSIDENTGKFRIPLGDPIQSKRVEQLINSIVKNHINKQLFAGGPAVLVTNWGRTKQLNIRFKDSDGTLLPTKREWEASGNKGSYEDYLKEHQHSVAYYECYASATTQELLRDFMDANGFIDIQSIEMLENGEELLKLIGYRIPTEDMYSIAPFRIVGFLPKECGDTFMQPWEMPAITGEDHDVDKKNLLRKDIRIERNKEYIKEDGREDYKKLRSAIADKIPSLKTLNGFAKIEAFLNGDRRAETNDELTKAIKEAYVNLKFKVVEPDVKVNDKNEFIADGETYSERKNSRNNHIFNMTWGLLTNQATTEKILNTGTFEPQKNLGYKITAMKEDPNVNWGDIDKLTTEQAKKKAFSRKYLPDFLTQTDYYENNSVAGNVLGQAAVQRIAHAILKNNGYGITMPENYSFSLTGQSFSGFVPIDKEFAYGTNEAIGKTLGNHVGAAADAVKDPVLNLLNINTNTFRTYATMLRLGVPFKIAGLMLSARVMDEVLAEHKKRSINRATRLSTVIEERLADIEKKYHFRDSKLAYEDLSEEELVSGLTKSTETDEGAAIAYKILTHWRDFETMTNAAQPLTVGTRYNSISSAVGPQVIDNKMQDYRANQANGESSSYRLVREYEISEGSGKFDYTPVGTMDVLERHPILEEYSKAYSIAETLLKDMPAQSEGFAKVLTFIPSGLKDIVMRDRGYLLDLSDFYQSYLLIKGNVINPDNLNYFVTTFPKEFITSNFKDKYKGNPFIDAIKPNTRTTKDGKEVLILNIDTSGMKTEQIDKIKLGWAQFHKSEPEMSRRLFEYNFAIAGIGYSPKTFMNCLPTQVKEQIPGYLDTYRKFPEISDEDAYRIFDQFVRNNWDENKLVPYIKLENVQVKNNENGLVLTTTNQEFRDLEYFKTNYKGNDVMFKYDSRVDEGNGVDGTKVFRYTFKETKPLGDNNSYLEINDHDIINPLRGGKVISDRKSTGNNSSTVNDATTTPTAKTKTPAEIERDIRDLRNILKAPNGSPIVGEAFYNRVRRGEFSNRRVAYQVAQGLVQTLKNKGVNTNEGILMEIVKKFC